MWDSGVNSHFRITKDKAEVTTKQYMPFLYHPDLPIERRDYLQKTWDTTSASKHLVYSVLASSSSSLLFSVEQKCSSLETEERNKPDDYGAIPLFHTWKSQREGRVSFTTPRCQLEHVKNLNYSDSSLSASPIAHTSPPSCIPWAGSQDYPWN